MACGATIRPGVQRYVIDGNPYTARRISSFCADVVDWAVLDGAGTFLFLVHYDRAIKRYHLHGRSGQVQGVGGAIQIAMKGLYPSPRKARYGR